MNLDLDQLANAQRLLFAIPLKPVLGSRFQPTGFPGLGAATFQTKDGACLLVESAQSMANRLELTIWDDAVNDVKSDVRGISHVTVNRQGAFLTDSILESHRLNSPYLLEESKKVFFNQFKADLGGQEIGPIDRKKFAEVLLKYDVGSLLHGVFLAKKELAGGRLRVARALSAFIEAEGVRVAASGGVKNDHVHPGKVEGDSKNLFGNIPYPRDEFTAERITLFVNLDLAQIRGYGLGAEIERLLTLLSLYKLRALLDGNLRLRSACDLVVDVDAITATTPKGFALPDLATIRQALGSSIAACQGKMVSSKAEFEDELKKGKEDETKPEASEEPGDED